MKDKEQKINFLFFYSCIISILFLGTLIFSYNYGNELKEIFYVQLKISAIYMAERDFYKGDIHFLKLKISKQWSPPKDSRLKTQNGYPIFYYYCLKDVSPQKENALIFVKAYNEAMKEKIITESTRGISMPVRQK